MFAAPTLSRVSSGQRDSVTSPDCQTLESLGRPAPRVRSHAVGAVCRWRDDRAQEVDPDSAAERLASQGTNRLADPTTSVASRALVADRARVAEIWESPRARSFGRHAPHGVGSSPPGFHGTPDVSCWKGCEGVCTRGMAADCDVPCDWALGAWTGRLGFTVRPT
jgi:hypothetical protein